MVNLPKEYEVTTKSLKEKLKDTTDFLVIEEVCTKLNARFKRINKKNEKNKDERGFRVIDQDKKRTLP